MPLLRPRPQPLLAASCALTVLVGCPPQRALAPDPPAPLRPPAAGAPSDAGWEAEALLHELTRRGLLRFQERTPLREFHSEPREGAPAAWPSPGSEAEFFETLREAQRAQELPADELDAVRLELAEESALLTPDAPLPLAEALEQPELGAERLQAISRELREAALRRPSQIPAPRFAPEVAGRLAALAALDEAQLRRRFADNPLVGRPLSSPNLFAVTRRGPDFHIIDGDDIASPQPAVERLTRLLAPLEASRLRERTSANLDATCLILRVFGDDEEGLAHETSTLSANPEVRLCAGPRAEERAVVEYVGSGVLIGPDRIATAAHCIKRSPSFRRSLRFVFGFHQRPDRDTVSFDRSQVYALKAVPSFHLRDPHHRDGPSEDHCVVQLTGSPQVSPVVMSQRAPAKGEALYLVGHPLGLSVRLSVGGKVLENHPAEPFFSTDLDNLPGFSGGGVFSSETHELVGVFAFGHRDFARAKTPDGGDCYELYSVDSPLRRGERVMKTKTLGK